MSNYTTFEVPDNFTEKLRRDTGTLWHMVYGNGGEEPDFVSGEDREFAEILADDFIERGESGLTVQRYILQVYGLKTQKLNTGLEGLPRSGLEILRQNAFDNANETSVMESEANNEREENS